NTREDNVQDWLYELRWQHVSADSEPTTATNTPEMTGNWVIFADTAGVGDSLAERLRTRGAHCTLVLRNANTQECDQQQMSPMRKEDFHRLLTALTTSGHDCTDLVFLWGLDTASSEQLTSSLLEEAQEITCNSIIYLVQTLLEVGWQKQPKLWLVTQGAQAVNGNANQITLAQAPLWGLGRVIDLEYPELLGSLIDLDPAITRPDILAEAIQSIIEQDRKS